MADEAFLSQVKRLFVGAPIPSHLAHRERFSRVTGLAVLSSDALSSVAYATEEVLRVLAVGGVAALSLVTPMAAAPFSHEARREAYPPVACACSTRVSTTRSARSFSSR